MVIWKWVLFKTKRANYDCNGSASLMEQNHLLTKSDCSTAIDLRPVVQIVTMQIHQIHVHEKRNDPIVVEKAKKIFNVSVKFHVAHYSVALQCSPESKRHLRIIIHPETISIGQQTDLLYCTYDTLETIRLRIFAQQCCFCCTSMVKDRLV